MKIVGDRRLRVVGSTPLGAGLGALAMLLAALGVVVFVPWIAGLSIGTALRRSA